jgi:hypothetical protein
VLFAVGLALVEADRAHGYAWALVVVSLALGASSVGSNAPTDNPPQKG